jgi:putative PIN family toxin of toxin-antitoxin system
MQLYDMRIVLDTSVVVAGLRSSNGASRRWLTSVLRGHHTGLVSVPLILEYEAVLTRAAQLAAIGLAAEQVGRFLDGLCSVAEHVNIASIWRPMLRDPEDEMVLETAVFGQADLLLTFNTRDFAGSQRFGLAIDLPGPAWLKAQGSRS